MLKFATINTISAKPDDMPIIKGRLFLKPWRRALFIAIMLFGPGVYEPITAKTRKGTTCTLINPLYIDVFKYHSSILDDLRESCQIKASQSSPELKQVFAADSGKTIF